MGHITLLSDFGMQDASAAVAKAVMREYNPAASITDITHEVTPFHTAEAAYLLREAYDAFPAGTCHVILFDLFPGRDSGLILCELNNHYFITTDNGIMPLLADNGKVKSWKHTEPTESFSRWLSLAANIIARLQAEKPEALQLPSYELKNNSAQYLPAITPGSIDGDAIHVDRFGNVVTNITRSIFNSVRNGRPFRLEYTGVEEITEISGYYTDVRSGYKLCRFNSNGHLEISVNRGRADSLFGLRPGSRFNDIKIIFE